MGEQPDRPALTGILETALYVDDMARSVVFYTDVLGFQVIASDDRISALSVRPGQVLLLCLRHASAALPHTAHDGGGQLHVAFSIPRPALAAWHATLEQQGVAIVDTRTWPRGGASLYFRDPDGNLVELATPGVWSVY